MSQITSQPVSSPLNDATVSPLLWGAASSSSPANNNLSRSSTRSTPIAIVRNNDSHYDDDSSSDEGGDVVHSFQQLVLESNQHDDTGQFCVGSLPTRRQRRHQKQQQLGTSLPAAPLLRSTRRNMAAASIPPISLTEGGQEETCSPSYGSLRESQFAGRFLDGPSSYREKSSGQIKSWAQQQQRVRFHSSSTTTPGERMQELRKQQTPDTPEKQPSSLSELMSTQPQSSFVDHEYSLENENVLSTSLTGLELLQRGLSIDERAPDSTLISSWSSSGANTYENVPATTTTDYQQQQQDTVNYSLNHANNNMSSSSLLADDEGEHDDGEHDAVFDLEM